MQIVERIAPATMDAAAEKLYAAGYEKLGAGDFGAVYKKQGAPYVLKLFTTDDYAYAHFVELARAHPNPHFPKIFGKTVRVNDEYYAVRIEELKPFPWFSERSQAYVEYTDRYIKAYGMPEPKNTNSYAWTRIMDARDWIEESPSLKEACDLIGQMVKTNHLTTDLKDANIMLRGNTMVFVDPVK